MINNHLVDGLNLSDTPRISRHSNYAIMRAEELANNHTAETGHAISWSECGGCWTCGICDRWWKSA